MELETEVINNVYKNAHIALQSISDVIPETQSENMRAELQNEYEGYEKFIGELSEFMAGKGIEPKDINVMKKAMLFTSIKMNALTDDSRSHIAEMMLKGTVMGISELRQIITRSQNKVSEEIIDYAKKLLALEEDYEKKLKDLL